MKREGIGEGILDVVQNPFHNNLVLFDQSLHESANLVDSEYYIGP